MNPVEKILERADNARVEGDGWLVSCPVPTHGKGEGDRDPSVRISESENGDALVNCRAGCSTDAVVCGWELSMKDLFLEGRNGYASQRRSVIHGGGGANTPPKTASTDQHLCKGEVGASLDAYSEYTHLPVEFLKGLGLKEYKNFGTPAVSMPYMDERGAEILLTRSRVSIFGSPKIKTRKGDRHRLYGLQKLQEAREAGYVFLVEGESDSQTLWYHGVPAVGIPGANGWKSEWASELEGIERLYFVVEDEAGERCFEKLSATPDIRDRLYRIDLDVKDVSKLHKTDPEHFKERLDAARENARAWLDIAETEQQERSREAWAECAELVEQADILSSFSSDLEKSGVSGENRNGKLLYLALTSRLLDRIISVAVKGPSSGGKSYLVGKVVSFFPESAVYSFSSFSDKTLYYTEEPLAHRHLILVEAAGGGETQEYAIRTLLSEGRLEYEFVEKTSEGLQARRIVKEGPTGFITTTTRHSLHAENETRYLSLSVKDTREQTREIFRAIADEDSERPDMIRWHALQEWIEGQDNRVTIPYAKELAEKIGVVAVRLRRDFSTVLSLIRSHAVLHQATRSRDSEGRIVATPEDYAAVRGLVADLIAEGVEATVPTTVRETVEAITKLIEDSDESHVSNREVASVLNIDKGAASRRIRAAIDRGYVKNLEDRKGHPAKLVLGESMPEDEEILPTADELSGSVEGVDVLTVFSGGYNTPLPPTEDKGPDIQGGGGSYSSSENGSTDQHLQDERERFVI